MGKYIEDAKTLYNQALQELERWQQTQDLTILRDGAEKAWGAVTQAANEVIDAYGRVVPSSTGARRQELVRLERQHRQLRALGLEGKFNSAELTLHRDCFYDGNCPVPYVPEKVVQDVKEFLDAVEQIAEEARR